MHQLGQIWTTSKRYRIILIVAVTYALLRLAAQGMFIIALLSSAPSSGRIVGVDLGLYLDAARRLLQHQELYQLGPLGRTDFYHYSPAAALAFAPLLKAPPTLTVILHSAAILVAWAAVYLLWARLFDRLGLERAGRMLAWSLPLWLVFSLFWTDLGFLNIYTFTLLLVTLLLEAILNENLARATLCLTVILLAKPQWIFILALPLLLGRSHFFLRLSGLVVLAYGAAAGATMLAVGPAYGCQQFLHYVRLLWNLPHNFPWQVAGAGPLGYNHSVAQIVVYLLGPTPLAFRLTTLLKGLLLAPLGLVSLRCLARPSGRPGREVPRLALDLAFALYLGAFIWLDVVWELSLAIVILPYLLATLRRRSARMLVWATFLPYALVDLWRVASFALLGEDAMMSDVFVRTDYSLYIPLLMIVLLTLYTLLSGQLIRRRAALPAETVLGESPCLSASTDRP